MLCCAHLNGEKVAYTLKRCKRKSIGLKIDANGLLVSVPLRTTLPNVESLLQDKADWITKKLAQWASKKSLELSWTQGATYPLLGEPWQLSMNVSGEIKMAPHLTVEVSDTSAPELSTQQIEKFVMAWYQQQAITCFGQRITLYAQKLRVPHPRFRLSRAKTRWGSCNARGVIHLNWRLIQMPLHLVDYVVAHELAHLLEMNHSPAFWQQVKSVYPDYMMARQELKTYG